MSWDGGQRLRRLRERTGLTMVEIAAYAGISTDTWANWERGNYRPTEHNQRKLCRALSNFLGRRVAWEEVDG